jgi:hypothetical protein
MPAWNRNGSKRTNAIFIGSSRFGAIYGHERNTLITDTKAILDDIKFWLFDE